mgnify:FL=1
MRSLYLRAATLVFVVLLVGCGSDELRVSGEVNWPGGVSLPAQAVLTVRLEGPAPGSVEAALAEARIPLDGQQPPVSFEFRVARTQLNTADGPLTVFARVDTAERLWLISEEPQPVNASRSRQRVRLRLEAL